MTNFKLYELAAYDLHNLVSLVDEVEKMQHALSSYCRYVDEKFTVILEFGRINITAYEMFERFAKTFCDVEIAARFTYKLCCMINEAELRGDSECDISDLFKHNEGSTGARALFVDIYNDSQLFICVEEKTIPHEEPEFSFIHHRPIEGYTEDFSYRVVFREFRDK